MVFVGSLVRFFIIPFLADHLGRKNSYADCLVIFVSLVECSESTNLFLKEKNIRLFIISWRHKQVWVLLDGQVVILLSFMIWVHRLWITLIPNFMKFRWCVQICGFGGSTNEELCARWLQLWSYGIILRSLFMKYQTDEYFWTNLIKHGTKRDITGDTQLEAMQLHSHIFLILTVWELTQLNNSDLMIGWISLLQRYKLVWTKNEMTILFIYNFS
jgi:hypothetical protein